MKKILLILVALVTIVALAQKPKPIGNSSGGASTAAAIVALFTGTPTGSKFLRDDGTLATAGTALTAGTDYAKPSLSDTYANIAAATCGSTETGRVGLTTDSILTARCSGTAWQWFLTGQRVTPVPSSGWTAQNQGGSTFTTSFGIGDILVPSSASTNMRVYERSLPSTPYTVEAFMSFSTVRDLNFAECGIGVKETSTGKLVHLRLLFDSTNFGTWGLTTTKSSSPTVAVANYATVINQSPFRNGVWLRMTDSGTNFQFFYSQDGMFWYELGSAVSRTDYLATPANVFVYGGVSNSQLAHVIVKHFKAE